MPSIEEVFKSPGYFIRKYEEAGLEGALPRIHHLLYQYIERKNIEEAIRRSLVESAKASKRLQHKPETGSKARRKMIKRARLAQVKKLARLRIVRHRYKLVLAKMPDPNQKLQTFPAIIYNPDELVNENKANLMVKHFRKQIRRREDIHIWL